MVSALDNWIMNPANKIQKRLWQAIIATVLPVLTVHVPATETTGVVTIIKPDTVQITDVDDLVLGTFSSLNASLTVSDEVCIYSSSGAYALVVTSANGAFALQDGQTTTEIPYSIDWLVASANMVSYGIPLVGLAGNATDVSCGGTTNASFQATVNTADFNAADPGGYSDTLTLLIQPE